MPPLVSATAKAQSERLPAGSLCLLLPASLLPSTCTQREPEEESAGQKGGVVFTVFAPNVQAGARPAVVAQVKSSGDLGFTEELEKAGHMLGALEPLGLHVAMARGGMLGRSWSTPRCPGSCVAGTFPKGNLESTVWHPTCTCWACGTRMSSLMLR